MFVSKYFTDLPAPPADTLARVSWVHDVLTRSMAECIEDTSISRHARRNQLLNLGRAVTAGVPKARLFEAEKLVKDDLDHQDETRGGELEDAPDDDEDAAPSH